MTEREKALSEESNGKEKAKENYKPIQSERGEEKREYWNGFWMWWERDR